MVVVDDDATSMIEENGFFITQVLLRSKVANLFSVPTVYSTPFLFVRYPEKGMNYERYRATGW